MSAFEISMTPTRLRGSKKRNNESREPVTVLMAPFSAKAIVQFEDVPVTKTAKRILRIINPSNEDIEVAVKKTVSAEHCLSIDWTEHVVPAENEIRMEMVWTPQMEVACKETLQFVDNRNFRKDVMIILKSKSNIPVRNTRKFPTVGRTLQLKSPTSGIKAQQQRKRQNAKAASPKSSTSTNNAVKKQWRTIAIAPQTKTTTTKRQTSSDTSAPHAPLLEKNVYLEPNREYAQENISPQNQNGCKENISPNTPNSMLTFIDNMKFTPAASVTKMNCQRVDNLALLPTPVERDYMFPETNLADLRPRRLLATELLQTVCEEMPSCSNAASTSHVITNKTFEIKYGETTLDLSSDTLDGSRCEVQAQTPLMNKTTTVTHTMQLRHLDVIREEEAGSPLEVNCSAQAPSNVINRQAEKLKQDIKMVGSPLRKYSESMKDLSLILPQTKLAIQGSMPNLNEMQEIRSIEQNRYFQQQPVSYQHVEVQMPTTETLQPLCAINSLDSSNCSEISLISHNEFLFSQSEILAQSSRFNLHEVGLKSRKCSPVKVGSQRKCTPATVTKQTKARNKLNGSAQKRRSQDVSFSDAPSTESLKQQTADRLPRLSPPKRQRVESADLSVVRNAPINASSAGVRSKSWLHDTPTKAKMPQTMSLMRKPMTPRKVRNERPVKLYDSELYLQSCINPDPFAATTTADPFLASTMYLDQNAVDRHLVDFKKWLNALVSIPAELVADCNTKVDVGKLFNEVRKKEPIAASTKEEQSLNYLTKFRLESLRRAAVELFFSEEMRLPCSKLAVYINKQAIRIRSDRNLHLDVVTQRCMLELLLCFNPLWLRLGLEVVYAEKIHLSSNSDIVGLTSFILNRLFRNKCEEQKFSKAYTLTDDYAVYIKKYTLQKILFLLLFLDKAKEKRIIKHNPCLFVKKSPHKETKDILLRFASELLANIGDITRDMKRLGYVLQHKQTYLDEFDYGFNNLAIDLRDGVRLTRVMEIILLRDELSKQLRVPAISRLQRIFNVNLALRALSEADFQLKGDITAVDIVDGHREKTLSLLWQIIYKFRSPKFHAAARVIQCWWRRAWLRVVIMRRIRHKEQLRRDRAATVIQSAFRGYQMRKFVRLYKAERVQAAITLQKYTRRYLAQKHLYQSYASIVRVQRWYRGRLATRAHRLHFLRLRESVIFLQRIWRRRQFARKLLLAAQQARLQHEQKCQAAAMCIQMHWRAWKVGRAARLAYQRQRTCIIRVQRRLRANWAMKVERQRYLALKSAVLSMQRRYRAQRQMRQQRQSYVIARALIVKVQQRWRATKEMRKVRAQYLQLRSCVTFVQRTVRATWQMRTARDAYQRLKSAAIVIQRRYRARLAMKQQQATYQKVRQQIICVQQRWRATIAMRRDRERFLALGYYASHLQQKFRGLKLMRQQRAEFLQLRMVTVQLQQRYRGKLATRQAQAEYQRLRHAALTIQRRFRAHQQMRFLRAKYRGTQAAVSCLQMHIRGYLLMKRLRCNYLQLRRAALVLQRAYRARKSMRLQRAKFLQLRAAVVCVQRRRRALLLMRQQRLDYLCSYGLIVEVQRRYRAKLYARQVRAGYISTLAIIVRMQVRIRGAICMRRTRQQYLQKRQRIMQLQQRFRAHLAMRSAQRIYQQQRTAASCIQHWYRSLVAARRTQSNYESLRRSTVTIQRKWRATLMARVQRACFLCVVAKVQLIQRALRATLAMRRERTVYERQRRAVVMLQQHYRARLVMLKMRNQYLLIYSLIVCVQRQFRAHRAMLTARADFVLLKRCTIYVQQKYRAKLRMRLERAQFVGLRISILHFQSRARGYLARQHFQARMTPEMMEHLRRKKAAIMIQKYWRGHRTRRRFRDVTMQTMRQRIVKLRQESSTVNSVRYKVEESVRFLSGRFIASDALNVLNRLDRLSRTVPHLLMHCSEFMATFCYGIMAQTIRSEVDKQLIERCSRIILNLARYNSTTANTFQEGGLVTIAQMLLRWCDKDSEIFNTLCTLIWIFSHCPRKCKIIRDYMTTTEAIYMLREIKKLVARKEKMKQNTRKPLAGVGRSNQQQQHNFSSRALPSLEPDFGIIRYRPYTFISSVYAFDTILYKMNIQTF